MTIKKIRCALGWTQQRLADYIGVNITTVQRWESGEMRTQDYTKRLLIKALKYDGYLPPDWK